jgi:hypothetical protein
VVVKNNVRRRRGRPCDTRRQAGPEISPWVLSLDKAPRTAAAGTLRREVGKSPVSLHGGLVGSAPSRGAGKDCLGL